MSHGVLMPGSVPPPPPAIVGRSEDLRHLKELLTKRFSEMEADVVSLTGHLVKQARAGKSLTQELLAERTRNNVNLIERAEAGRPIPRQTAIAIAKVLAVPLDQLKAPTFEPTSAPTPIVMRGLPGVGKTTLAAALVHDSDIKRAFPDGILWASLGQFPNLSSELGSWARALGANDIQQEEDLETVRSRLAALVRDKRMLLVVDDVWEPEQAQTLFIGGQHCSTLVTTRITGVADALAPNDKNVYALTVLSEGEALELLEGLAPDVITSHRNEARDLARELEWLPLALQVAGRLLRAEATHHMGVADLLQELRNSTRLLDERAPAGELTKSSVATLFRKSTDVLDDRARECFAYLAPFAPKPATFDLLALTAVWNDLADAKVMVKLLAARGLLEPIGAGRFWMHAMLVAHAKSLLHGGSI
jgi:transcriptional regulator with XRE-family HTH domain